MLNDTKLSGRDLGGILVPSCECHALSWIVNAVPQHMIRKRAKMVHPDDCASMTCRDALILKMVQVLHRGVVDNLSR